MQVFGPPNMNALFAGLLTLLSILHSSWVRRHARNLLKGWNQPIPASLVWNGKKWQINVVLHACYSSGSGIIGFADSDLTIKTKLAGVAVCSEMADSSLSEGDRNPLLTVWQV